jgi:hypothetical protein
MGQWAAPYWQDTRRKTPRELRGQTLELAGRISCLELHPFIVVETNEILDALLSLLIRGIFILQ